jgi:Tfp pilus assembly protein FimT
MLTKSFSRLNVVTFVELLVVIAVIAMLTANFYDYSM